MVGRAEAEVRPTFANARNRSDPDGPMTSDEWQAHMTREAALEIGRWLEARGRLHAPIASLTLGDLEAVAAAAISRWIVLQSERLQRAGWPTQDPIAKLLLG